MRLGFDDVARHPLRRRAPDGTYDGHVRRRVRLGPGKAAGDRRLGRRRTASTSPQSWAYSDSCYDLPMLGGRRPPGRREPRPAADRAWRCCGAGRSCTSTCPPACPRSRWSASSRSGPRCALVRPELIPYARFDITGVENLPSSGPAIVVGNHRSYFDPLAMAVVLAKARPARALPRQEGGLRRPGRRSDRQGDGRHPRGAGHRLRRAARRGGAPRLAGRRGRGADARGHHPAGKAFFNTTLKGRWGAAKLAAHDRRAGHPGRPVGHREGVAPVRAPPRTSSPCATRRRSRISVGTAGGRASGGGSLTPMPTPSAS